MASEPSPFPFPNEVIEKLVESLMWGLQDRLEEKNEGGATAEEKNSCEGGESNTKISNVSSGDCSEEEDDDEVEDTKQLNSTNREIIRQYAAIPLVSRSFRDAYLRFFTTLPALSYDASRAPGEVRLYRQQLSLSSSPAAAATVPCIVAAPGVVKMLATNRGLGHLKWVHITTTHHKYRRCELVVGASPLECLYQLLGIPQDSGNKHKGDSVEKNEDKKGGAKVEKKNSQSAPLSTKETSSGGGAGKSDGGGKMKVGRKKRRGKRGGKNSKGHEQQSLTTDWGCFSKSSNGAIPFTTQRHGVLLELDGAHVEICAEKMSGLKRAMAFHSLFRGGGEWIALNVALGLNATALHIGYTTNSLTVTPSFYIPATPAVDSPEYASFVSREDFSRITRLTLSGQVKSTTEMTPFPSEDWVMLIGRVLERCSGCRELRWELTDERIGSWPPRSNILRSMAKQVLPAIQSEASIHIHYNFAPRLSENENMRQRFFEHDQVLFQLGELVAQVDEGDNAGAIMTREIVVTQRNEKNNGDDEEESEDGGDEKGSEEVVEKAGDFLDQLGREDDGQKEWQSMGRRSVRWSIKY